ncbi:PIN2/TERF1-interacting telomerase inhibitor 1 [Musca vetustissima]|uniref:PIN2/TERF1-interacting telomerase inhibitor 1 n=1 Tax=Musca vetustissima TaxID=27455 RepID=UPI002AB7E4CE|nr:PIN2/TERF1-interacting telomerase inhibitor 1 [Musca vetustissima]
MAMLAEPRQRKRYNLVPKGKALYEDDSRFGTKMLEKMGWSKGKGLGAKEDGSQDFVRVRYKNDSQGLGYEQRDDQWTQHESSFNDLLKNLNGDDTAEGATTNIEMNGNKSSSEDDDAPRVGFGFQTVDKPKHKKAKLKEEISGVSLEERSKQSKARVHYKKFTKGKDLSQYSEKDLANIFGKKAADDEQQALFDQMNQHFNGADQSKDVVENKSETENFGGVQTISTGLSVSEYFKLKMASLKKKSSDINVDLNEKHETDSHATKEHKKKREAIAELDVQYFGVEKENTEMIIATANDQDAKKEKRKANVQLDEEKLVVVEDGNIRNELCETTKKKKKKHNRKDNKDDDHKIGMDLINIERTVDQNMPINGVPKVEHESVSVTEKEDVSPPNATVTSKSTSNKICSENFDMETIGQLSLPELEDKLKSFNTCKISTFIAEKFRNVDLNYFPNSTLSQVEGYGCSQDIELIISANKKDEKRINNLWSNTLCKYANLQKPTITYRKYVRDCIKARKNKQPKPKLKVKKWKRKDAFSLV